MTDSDALIETCDVCGRQRPKRAISIASDGRRYCNDDHNDTACHLKVIGGRLTHGERFDDR